MEEQQSKFWVSTAAIALLSGLICQHVLDPGRGGHPFGIYEIAGVAAGALAIMLRDLGIFARAAIEAVRGHL